MLNRYLRALLKSSKYRLLAFAMAVLQTGQVVAEMIAHKRWGAKIQSRVCLWIETAKFALRMAMLHVSKTPRMLAASEFPVRDFDVAKLEPVPESASTGYWKAPRSGQEFFTVATLSDSSPSSHEKAMQFMLSRALLEPAVNPLDLMSPLRGLRLVGEYVYLARPLLYILAVQKYGVMSYKPWTLSLVLELLALAAHLDFQTGGLNPSMTALEKETLAGRYFYLAYYLVKNPLYSSFTKPRIGGFAHWTSTKPIVHIIGSVLNDYSTLFETYHFYTSGF
ncbi:Peroxisomal membrane protein pex16 [Kappamyces sp. JEL0680]|nr:Peroxisomal membrane protein pex16 [Kappamyces sp. JEL0680]